MATANIVDSLKCSICCETLVDPRALQCGHSYCGPPKNCLEYIKHSRNTESKCAVCNKVFSVKVSDLSPLYGIRDAIGCLSVGNNEVEKGQFCNHAKENLKMWCRDCSTALCVPCVDAYHTEHNLKSYKSVLKEQAQNLLPELESAEFQLYQIANEIKQLQLRQKDLEERVKYKTAVKEIADGSTVSTSSYLMELLNSKQLDVRQNWVSSNDRKPFEFILTIENMPFQIEKTEFRFSADYHLGDFNFTAKCEAKKYDNEDWVGLFLRVNPIVPKQFWKLRLKHNITLLNITTANNVIKGYATDVFDNNSAKGRRKFILLKDVINLQNGFIVNQATIGVKIEIKDLKTDW